MRKILQKTSIALSSIIIVGLGFITNAGIASASTIDDFNYTQLPTIGTAASISFVNSNSGYIYNSVTATNDLYYYNDEDGTVTKTGVTSPVAPARIGDNLFYTYKSGIVTFYSMDSNYQFTELSSVTTNYSPNFSSNGRYMMIGSSPSNMKIYEISFSGIVTGEISDFSDATYVAPPNDKGVFLTIKPDDSSGYIARFYQIQGNNSTLLNTQNLPTLRTVLMSPNQDAIYYQTTRGAIYVVRFDAGYNLGESENIAPDVVSGSQHGTMHFTAKGRILIQTGITGGNPWVGSSNYAISTNDFSRKSVTSCGAPCSSSFVLDYTGRFASFYQSGSTTRAVHYRMSQAWVDTMEAMDDAIPPFEASDVSVSNPSSGTATITWPDVSDPKIKGYVVTAYTNGESDRVITVGPEVHSVTFTNLVKGKTWSFKIQIKTDSGLGNVIDTTQIEVPVSSAPPPSNVGVTDGNISWSDPGTHRVCFYSPAGVLMNCQDTSNPSIPLPSGTGTATVSTIDQSGNPGPSVPISGPPHAEINYDGNGNVTGSTGTPGLTIRIYSPGTGSSIIATPGTPVPPGSIVTITPPEGQGLETPVRIPLNIDNFNGDVTISWPLFPIPSIIGYRVTAYKTGETDIVKETDAYTTSVVFKSLPNPDDWNFRIDVITVQGDSVITDSPITNEHNSLGDENNGTGDVDITIQSSISLTLNDDVVDLSDIPGTTDVVTDDNEMNYTVTTNNLEGYTVTIKSDQAALNSATVGNTDNIPVDLITVAQSDSQNGTGSNATALSSINENQLYSQDQRSTESGDSFTSTFNLTEVPWVNADDYTGTVTYTATAN